MNTKTATLTEKYLKDINAFKEDISFAKRNKLLGLPLALLDQVKGDYEGFVSYLQELPTLEYDANGNMTKKIYPNGRIYQWEYDANGNMTKKIYPDGSIYQYMYDANGNKTKEIYPDGSITQYQYDANGNKIKEICPDGSIHQWEYTYYNNGQLKQIKQSGRIVLEIPYFGE